MSHPIVFPPGAAHRTRSPATPAVIAALVFLCGGWGHAAPAEDIPPYSNLSGQVVLDNQQVLARRFFVKPGQSTGVHLHPEAELLVYVKGGVLQHESDGRSVLWRDARVVWNAASSNAEESVRNVGKSTIQFVQVVLKPHAADPSAIPRELKHLSYPNIPLEDLFENDRVIVQRFQMNPGEWEGVHSHPPNTLYIFVKGGTGGHWVSKTTSPPTKVSGYSPEGDVGWMQPVDISAGHQSGNTGTTPSDVIWIALKD